jgi:uncharacterized protein (DUF1501 family)
MESPEVTTRREFLHGGLTLLATGATVPAFLNDAASAVQRPTGRGLTKSIPGVPADRVLVVVQLAGGNDGLNTVVPFRQDAYYKRRPTLAIKANETLKISGSLGFHPNATGFKKLFDEGRLAVVQSVGYPNANRSHFRSTDVWESGSPDGLARTGWLGRYLDHARAAADGPESPRAIALTPEAPLSLLGNTFRPTPFTALPHADAVNAPPRAGATGGLPASADLCSHVGPAGVGWLGQRPKAVPRSSQAPSLRPQARPQGATGGSPASANLCTHFTESLRAVAQSIASEAPTRVYYLALGGFDTHANQADRHSHLLAELTEALAAFLADLDATGHADRVLVMTFSEFGRSVAENVAAGTDHGHAAPMFLLGTSVQPGIIGDPPDLTDPHHNAVPSQIDFRRVYASILAHWLEADATQILGAPFAPLPVLHA